MHNLFINDVEDAIRSQLKAIRDGLSCKAQFAQKVHSARSSEVVFDMGASSSQSKYEPDGSFCHVDAKYPGVIIEIVCSPKKRRLSRLAETYILDSDSSIRAVVGLDIKNGRNCSCKATLSVWRPQLSETADGVVLQAVEEVVDEVGQFA